MCVYCSDGQKFYNKLASLITPHRLKIFPRYEIEICSLEYTLSGSMRVHTICVKIWSGRGISGENAIFTAVNYCFWQRLSKD